MNSQTYEMEPEDKLEALTNNFRRQMEDSDLSIPQKIDALVGNVKGVEQLGTEFISSSKGRRAIGVALNYFSASLPGDEKIAMPVKAAIVATGARTCITYDRDLN